MDVYYSKKMLNCHDVLSEYYAEELGIYPELITVPKFLTVGWKNKLVLQLLLKSTLVVLMILMLCARNVRYAITRNKKTTSKLTKHHDCLTLWRPASRTQNNPRRRRSRWGEHKRKKKNSVIHLATLLFRPEHSILAPFPLNGYILG